MPIKKHNPKLDPHKRIINLDDRYAQLIDIPHNPVIDAQDNFQSAAAHGDELNEMNNAANNIGINENNIANQAEQQQFFAASITELINYVVGESKGRQERLNQIDRDIFHNACSVYLSPFFKLPFYDEEKRNFCKKYFSNYSSSMFSPQSAPKYYFIRVIAFWQWGRAPHWVGGATTRQDVNRNDFRNGVAEAEELTENEFQNLTEQDIRELKEIKIAAVFYHDIFPKLRNLTPEIQDAGNQAQVQLRADYLAIVNRVRGNINGQQLGPIPPI